MTNNRIFGIAKVMMLLASSCMAVGQFAQAKSLDVALQKDNLLSIINPKTKKTESAKEGLKVYYEKAIPLARSFGYQNHGTLRVTETVVGSKQPGVFVLASWPSNEADLTFESDPRWQDYKGLRNQIWEELNFYKAPTMDAKTLTFSQDKYYSVAFAWLDGQNPNDYRAYMDGIQDAVSEAGGKFIHSMVNPRHVSMNEALKGPDEITFVQWDSEQGLLDFQQSEGFKRHAHLLKNGTKQFELYRVQPVIK
ncbi:MAG: hypothetical protein Alis3KO_28290 [Aliiglaciecola sp.]